MSRLARLRIWFARRLLRDETWRVVEHYRQAAEQARRAGDDARAERCAYIVIGATYVGQGGHRVGR